MIETQETFNPEDYKDTEFTQVNNPPRRVDQWWQPEAGMVQLGKLVDTYEGVNGPVSVLLTGDGRVGLPSHKVLSEALSGVPRGSVVRITCKGQVKSASGQRYYDYLIEVPKGGFETPSE